MGIEHGILSVVFFMRSLRVSILIILLSLASNKGMANDYKLVVWFNNGNKMEVLFNEFPLFEYADGNLTLKYNKTDISWPISQLSKFTIDNGTSIETGVHGVPFQQFTFSLADCEVYDLNGKKITTKVQTLAELPKGVYIIKKGSITTKATVR